MEVITSSNQESTTSIRVIRALIGLGMTVPIVANLGLAPWVTFGLAITGASVIASAIISKTTTASILICTAAILAMIATLASAVTVLNPISISMVSLVSVAAMASGLLGIELENNQQKATIIENQKYNISNVDKLFPNAANEKNVAA